MLGECTDEPEALAADEMGDESVTGRIRKWIEEIFDPKKNAVLEIDPASYLRERIEELKPQFTHREVEIVSHLEEGAPFIRIPSEVLQKVVDGLIRNAVENTLDEGKIEVPEESDIRPGRISQCPFCSVREVCYYSGGTAFTLFFPAARENRPSPKDEL